jgi:hypothetical protein
MTLNPTFSARWIPDFEKQLYRRRHIILYGNIHDQFLWRGAYLGIHDFLQNYFQDLAFPLILRYDPIDGFIFAKSEMSQQFEQISQQHLPQNQAPQPLSSPDSPPSQV